jgi:hypothetical protein
MAGREDEAQHGITVREAALFRACIDLAMSCGAGQQDLANAAMQASAYIAGSEYDDPGRRKAACDAILETFRARIASGQEHGLTAWKLGEGVGSPSPQDLFTAMMMSVSVLAPGIGSCPLEASLSLADLAASSLLGWGRFNGLSDDRIRSASRPFEAAFSFRFDAARAQGAASRESRRIRKCSLAPLCGWRGTSDLPEEDPGREHPSIVGFLLPAGSQGNLPGVH